MPTIENLTDAKVRNLRKPEAGQVDYFDGRNPGLALRVSAKGRAVWTYTYRVESEDEDGKRIQRRMTLGIYQPALKPQPDAEVIMSLADARKAYGAAHALVAGGKDPAEEKKREQEAAAKAAAEAAAEAAPINTVSQLFEDYMADTTGQKGKRKASEVRRCFNHDVLPMIGDKPITDVTKDDIVKIRKRISGRGADAMANRAVIHVGTFLNWLVAEDVLPFNPAKGINRPKVAERDRVLSDAELAKIMKAAKVVGYPFGDAIRLLALTACRRDEIGRLKWPEVNLDASEIRLTGDRTKNGELKVIPLNEPALRILKRLQATRKFANCDFVFSTDGRTSISAWDQAKQKINRACDAGFGGRVENWRFHDFRRSVTTFLQSEGVDILVAEAVLGHLHGSKTGAIRVYARHAYTDEKRDALDRWGRHVEGLMSEPEGKVVRLVAN